MLLQENQTLQCISRRVVFEGLWNNPSTLFNTGKAVAGPCWVAKVQCGLGTLWGWAQGMVPWWGHTAPAQVIRYFCGDRDRLRLRHHGRDWGRPWVRCIRVSKELLVPSGAGHQFWEGHIKKYGTFQKRLRECDPRCRKWSQKVWKDHLFGYVQMLPSNVVS